MRVQTLSTGIFDCLTTQLVRDRTKFGEKVELEVAVFGRDGLRFLELEVLPESKKQTRSQVANPSLIIHLRLRFDEF